MGYVTVLACWTLAGTFLLAAMTKLRDLSSFAASIAALGYAPPTRAPWVAAGVIGAELAVAGLCALPRGPAAAAGLSLGAVLLTVFGAAAISAKRGRRVVPCRCFGSSGAPLGLRHAIRNGLLLILTGCGLMSLAVDAPLPDVAGLALIAFSCIVLVAFVARADDLIDLAHSANVQPARR